MSVGTVLWLLLLFQIKHLAADYLFQSGWMVRNKAGLTPRVFHAAESTGLHRSRSPAPVPGSGGGSCSDEVLVAALPHRLVQGADRQVAEPVARAAGY
ncbi:MAG: hypothetical protein ACE368_03585 [Paracoccaceae bacterium]